MEAVSHLNQDQVTADLNAAADYALKLPASNGKLFLGGFCWGGSQTFRFATNRPDLAAAFVFYGGPPEKDAMARIKAPVYGFYAGNDARINATLPEAIAQMKAAGKSYDLVTYDGAGHGFMRAGEALMRTTPTEKPAPMPGSAGRACLASSDSAQTSAARKTRHLSSIFFRARPSAHTNRRPLSALRPIPCKRPADGSGRP